MATEIPEGAAIAAARRPNPSGGGRRGGWLVKLFGVVLIAAILGGAAVAGWFFATRDGTEAAGDDDSTTSTTEAEDDVVAAPTTPTSGSIAPSTEGVVTTVGIDPITQKPWPDDLRTYTRSEIEEYNYPRAIVVGSTGEVVLKGRMPSQEMIDASVARSELGGVLQVNNQFEIDPAIPFFDKVPVYADEVVNFEFNSAEIADEFLPVLDLGVLALTLNPRMTGVIVAHTDSVGSEEANLEIANERANSVREYWIAQGVGEEQIRIEARGEEFATENADPEVAARDRRVEFAFDGFFG